MKILFLANAASIHTVRWVNSLVDRNHEVHLVFNKGNEPTCNKINSKVIIHKLKYSGTKGYFVNTLELKKYFKKIKPDVVNAHYASGYGVLARLSKLSPLILSVWGSDVYSFPYRNSFSKKLVVENLLYADKIASTSYCMAEQVKNLMNVNKENIFITPFGVDLEKFKKRNIMKKNDNILIGNIKTLSPTYGIDILIKSIRVLMDSLNEKNLSEVAGKIKVYIYGEGNQKNELEKLIETLRLEKIVYLKGSIPNDKVPNALEELDIFCVTSLTESFGVAVVEAMAMELPVVATDADGFKEIINHENTGFIVERNNIDKIANALEKLVLNENLRVSMGIKGRERVIEQYDWEKNVDAMIGLYTNLEIKRS
ncbi:glycosyltransferase [Planococcus salinarum]|uniref:glycosyltransferase n=1 Tax=Planococcus salinarum TaxID=622695 RepID=UPI000E3C5B69|nr:glycosyltransferase [Planococcus salinarum]TAA72855.1 glycosyltransferase family 4 protein [Planococcus salinarum]